MALFKEIFCKECGAKAGMLARTKLGDGNYICNKCLTIVPNYIKKCLSDYSYEQYMMMKQYLIWSTSELGKVFKENHYFHGIHIDTALELRDQMLLLGPKLAKLSIQLCLLTADLKEPHHAEQETKEEQQHHCYRCHRKGRDPLCGRLDQGLFLLGLLRQVTRYFYRSRGKGL